MGDELFMYVCDFKIRTRIKKTLRNHCVSTARGSRIKTNNTKKSKKNAREKKNLGDEGKKKETKLSLNFYKPIIIFSPPPPHTHTYINGIKQAVPASQGSV